MSLAITAVLCPQSKWGAKCPYPMTPTRVVIHNTANDASAMNEISYMNSNNNQVSYHFAVDDTRAVQGIPLNRNAWHAGDGAYGSGNRYGIAIEICYSKSGGSRFTKAEQNGAELAAMLLKQYGWGIDRLTKHQDYSGKYCPHRTLDLGWQRFVNMVSAKLAELNGQPVPKPTPTPSTGKINVKYQCYDRTHGWLDWITNYNNVNSNGYAGWMGFPITGFVAYTPGSASAVGNLEYRLHVKNGGWFNWRRDQEVDSVGDKFAGDLKQQCDGLQMRLVNCPGHNVRYRVHLTGGSWLDWVTGYGSGDNGYAGLWGYSIDAVQVEII